MDSQFLALTLIVLLGFVILAFLIKKWVNQRSVSDELVAWLKSTNTRMDQQSRNISERLDNASRVIASVQKNLGEVTEIGRNMSDLQEFLRSPKLRGNIGEQILKELLSQVLPKQSFHLQYAFKSGAIVDAAIKTGNGLVPIDSKFPMENFRLLTNAKTEVETQVAKKEFAKDVKKHIDDISRKYILTDEGTIDYALMYIPSEAIYYEVVNNSSLFDYSAAKRVLPVSATTFYAYIRAILISFEGQKIEEKAKQILSSIRAIQKDYEKVDSNLSILGKHITNTYNMMNQTFSTFTSLGQKIKATNKIGDLDSGKEKLLQ
ncbi:DNA recombination protein RmuC [Candidatus Gottesmanbacteria bacterium]|nr:DNA recombination protein RmuC [Candidatus Gottesmanbacteria bacterium]